MSCTYINLSSSPYDESTVDGKYDTGGCNEVELHFNSHPIAVGDCIVIGSQAYHITAVNVLCNGSPVYSAGDPGGNGDLPVPDHTHNYATPPVAIQFWLAEMLSEELSSCTGYP